MYARKFLEGQCQLHRRSKQRKPEGKKAEAKRRVRRKSLRVIPVGLQCSRQFALPKGGSTTNPLMGGPPANPMMGGPPANPMMGGPPANLMMGGTPVNPMMGAAKSSEGNIDFRSQLKMRLSTQGNQNGSSNKSGVKKKKEKKQPAQQFIPAQPAFPTPTAKVNEQKKKKKEKVKQKETSLEPIPEPMEEKHDFDYEVYFDFKTLKCYYWDIRNGISMYDKPKGTIKDLWIFHVDPESKDFYYECMNTGETSWDMPNEFQDPKFLWTVQYIARDNSFIYIDNRKAYVNEQAARSTKPPDNWDGPLPATDDWARYFDEGTHQWFYENIRTGATQWDEPPGVQFS